MSARYQFATDYHCPVGVLESVAPGLRRITANNPGPLTFRGTGTYVVGRQNVAVIDPGPDDPAHIEALLSELGGEKITHILVTHTHRDHSAGVALLQQHCGAPSYSLGTHTSLQRPSALPAELDAAGDTDFTPDIVLTDNQILRGDDWELQCLHTPGHASNHAAFAEAAKNRVFVGDLVMGWSTPVLLPPDGHLSDYLTSLERLQTRKDQIYWPTHGGPVRNPQALVEYLIQHRQQRTEAVMTAVESGHVTLPGMVEHGYPGLDDSLKPAAMRSALASVIYLMEQGKLTGDLAHGLNLTCQLSS